MGNYGSQRMPKARYNVPFSDTVALRVSLQSQNRDDRVHNPRPTGTRDFEGYKDNAGRVQLLIQPNKAFSALFNLHARDLDNNATLFRANIIKQGTNELVDGFDYGSYPSDGVQQADPEDQGRQHAPALEPGPGDAALDHRLREGRVLQPRRR